MKKHYKAMTFSVIFGLLAYIFFSALEYLFSYGKDYWGIIASDMSTYEVFIRLVKVAIFIACGVFVSKILTGHKRTEETLTK